MILISAGVRPETTLARAMGIDVGDGILVDDRMKTSMNNVYAAGDAAEHRGRCYGIWPAALEQGRAAGSNMAGREARYGGTVPANKLKVAGVNLFAAGNLDCDERMETRVRKNDAAYIYRKLVLKDHKIIGAVLLGDIRGSDEIQKAIRTGVNVSGFGDDLADGDFNFMQLH